MQPRPAGVAKHTRALNSNQLVLEVALDLCDASEAVDGVRNRLDTAVAGQRNSKEGL